MRQRSRRVGLSLFSLLCLGGSTSALAQEVRSDSIEFPVLTGEYLGQETPGLTPAVFAPGLFTSPLGIAVLPDGREIAFASWGEEPRARIMISRIQGGRWTAPETAPFSGEYMDWDINFSPNGKRLYFTSRRPGGLASWWAVTDKAFDGNGSSLGPRSS